MLNKGEDINLSPLSLILIRGKICKMKTIAEFNSPNGKDRILINLSYVSVVNRFPNENTRIVVNGKVIYVQEEYEEVKSLIEGLGMLL